uniref:hypothetical protein n=1 Tax=uncultured Altererythrobacter sp. TaxID=500840 RepID=UPI00261E8DA8|nr:hypothetical protein [uncultured Altererythrobacter sp.]
MPFGFELSSYLPNTTDEVWAAVERPALFLHVAAPLVKFTPMGRDAFPERWEEGEYRGAMKLFGLIPIGWQAIVISFPSDGAKTRTLKDGGYSPLLAQWTHTIEVAREGDGTRYTDRISYDAGWLSPFAYPLIRLFFAHRQHRLRRLAKAGFASLKM